MSMDTRDNPQVRKGRVMRGNRQVAGTRGSTTKTVHGPRSMTCGCTGALMPTQVEGREIYRCNTCGKSQTSTPI